VRCAPILGTPPVAVAWARGALWCGIGQPMPATSRSFLEPLRPSDGKWRGRNGELRSDLGPLFPIVQVNYSDGSLAVAQQEDGCGFANYRSGHKAVCVLCHHKSRRVSAVAYADSDFAVRSAVPVAMQSPAGEAKSEAKVIPGLQPRKNRSRTLGHIDEWGIGSFETVPDVNSGVRGQYKVSPKYVTVQTLDGRKMQVARGSRSSVSDAALLKLPLTPELAVSYDGAHDTTVLQFSCEGVNQTFYLGEVWRMPSGQPAPTATVTTPSAIFNAITLKPQVPLDASCNSMVDKATSLDKTLKISSSSTCLKELGSRTLSGSSSAPVLKLGDNSLMDKAKTMCEGRIDFKFEHLLHKTLVNGKCATLKKTPQSQDLREGFLYPQPYPGSCNVEPGKWVQPVSLQPLTSRQVIELAAALETRSVLLVVLVVADWATGSCNNSSAHARLVCEAAYSELSAQEGVLERLHFAVAELTEAGAVHSTRRWENPLVKQFGVQDAPWMLMFMRGQCVYSDRPAPEDGGTGFIGSRGGLGFASRLRYPTLAKPRVLILEPTPKKDGEGSNHFKLQLETQDVLKKAKYDWDLTLSLTEARRLASITEPAYGLFLCSSEVGALSFTEVATRVRQRNPKALCYICHDRKGIGDLDEQLRMLAEKGDIIAGIFERPLSKSRLDKAFLGIECVRVKYPQCGMGRDGLVELIKSKLNS